MKNKVMILFLVLVMVACASISGTFGLEASGEKTEGLITEKSAFPTEDGKYTVRLEAYTTGEVATQTLNIPSDIVLVLDQSGSMAECMECGQDMEGTGQHFHYKATFRVDASSQGETYYIKSSNNAYSRVYYCSRCQGWFTNQRHSNSNHAERYKYLPKESQGDTNTSHTQFYIREACVSRKTALTNALNAFVGEVCKKAAGEDGGLSTTSDNVNHRIAIVGFAHEAGYSFNNTELFIGSNHYTYGTSAQARYGNAFQDMSTASGQNNVAASINQLDAEGATYINLGMEMANGILRENPIQKGEQRNRVVVVFTDGAPGFNGTYEENPVYGKSGDAAIVASRAMAQGNTAKNDYGATIYTVGIFSGADGSSSGNQYGTPSEKANWFMQQLSSNNGVPVAPGYYLSASDRDTLIGIFKQISEQICTPDIELGPETEILDKVSPYFTPPEDTTDIEIYTAAYDGSQFNERAKSDLEASFQDDGTICVKGFDFNENFVTDRAKEDGTYGKKLIIEFTVEPRPGFLGGNGVPTNAENAGVYAEDGTMIGTFPQPKVDVPIKDVTVKPEAKNVYLLGNLTVEQLSEDLKISAGSGGDVVVIDGGKENFGLEKWQNEFVDISILISEEAYSDLTEDTEYQATCKILPKTGAGGKEATEVGKINVFTPQLTFKDTTKYYGEAIDEDFHENLVDTQWLHGNTPSTDVKMYGETPFLTLNYQEDSGKIQDGKVNTKADFSVMAEAKIGGREIGDFVTFVHEDCAPGEEVPEGKAFLIHVKTCQLTITKVGGDAKEPYVFVINNGEGKYTEGTIIGNGTITISELPVGTYTVNEEDRWSWRYTPYFEGKDTVNLSCDKPQDAVICRNKRVEDKWLNGYSDVVTNIFANNIVVNETDSKIA